MNDGEPEPVKCDECGKVIGDESDFPFGNYGKGEPILCDACEEAEEARQEHLRGTPDYGAYRADGTDSPSYRNAMKDAGRGHLLD